MITRSLKIHACLTVGIAILFYLFFQLCKHQPALAQVNTFADDPYDAIGSFAVQFALLTALLSLMRALRPYQQKQASEQQKLLLVRGSYFSCLSIMITLIADIIAMCRQPAIWMNTSAGYVLVALIGGMMLITLLEGWLLFYWSRIQLSTSPIVWIRAIGLIIANIIILSFYQESWRQSTIGELLTVVLGALLLFIPLWGMGTTISSAPGGDFEDALDDIRALYHWLKLHSGPLMILYSWLEWIIRLPVLHAILSWLNPRKHFWTPAIIIGIGMGFLLTLGETFGEGGTPHQIGRFALIATVFVSLECCAIIIGYVLLARPLGLFQRSDENRNQRVSL